MLKKSITFYNFDGEEVTEEFYFNMTKAEIIKLELSEDESFQARIERIQKPGTKGRDVLETFDMIIRQSYGVRTPEGKFVKRPDHFEEFLASEAYSNLLFEISTNAQKAAEFVNGIMPKDIEGEMKKMQEDNPNMRNIFEEAPVQDVVPAPHVADMEDMSEEELRRALGVEPEEVTEGFSDSQILAMTGGELATKPKAVLLRAYKLKNK